MDAPPSFRAELYFLVAKLLENGPCQSAAQTLRKELESHEIVPARYDWKGQRHQKTFKDMEDEFGEPANEYLLNKCFELCTRLNPGSSNVRSLLKKESSTIAKKTNFLQRLANFQTGLTDNSYKSQWHTQLAKNMKLLRRTFGHLSSVYCLIFDRSGQLVLTGADDMLVKCWSFIDGRLIHTFRGASSEISDLAVSQDNKLIAAGSCDKVIRVWELHTGNPVAVLTKHTGTITAINFCPYLLDSTGCKYLASTSGDGTVSFWRYHYDTHGHTQFDEAPTRYHEKIRPGKAQMICASFSPGGIFFCVGSADHNVRVYKMNGPEGPVRILEEELHEDRVDSIQWCNTPNELRFLSGSRDGTARIWTYANQMWNTIVLNMKTEDNQEPSKNKNSTQTQQPTTMVSTSRSGRQTNSAMNMNEESDTNSQSAADNATALRNQIKKMKSVTMVAWSLDDAMAITAVSDLTLKIWDAHKGNLLFNLAGHEDEIFVLEPHPYAMNLLLTAAHDGHLIVWDLDTKKQLFKHRNMIEQQGHGPVFDAKWSKDGTTICASDSHGHVMFLGQGSFDRYSKCPTELFFHTDYRPLLRDTHHNVVDEQTQLPPHLLPPPFLVDSEGDPYPANIQRLVRGRENITERDGLVPIGPEPSFQAPHQPQELIPEDDEGRENDNDDNANNPRENENENPEERLNRFRNEMIRNIPNNSQNNSRENENGNIQQEEEENNPEMVGARTSKLVILKENTNAQEIKENVDNAKASALLETALFHSESSKEGVFMDHDYSRPNMSKLNKKSRSDPRSRGSRGAGGRGANNTNNQSQTRNNRQQRPERSDDDDDDEDEPNADENQERNDDDETSDCSLDESDIPSADSTTDVSSEHSDWGSDHSENNAERSTEVVEKANTRQKGSSSRMPRKAKKKRNAAQKAKERLQRPVGDIGEEYMPSPWLSENFPRKAPYFPQIGDILMVFKKGYEKYMEFVELRNTYKVNKRDLLWMKRKSLEDGTLVKVSKILFEIRPPRLCVVKVEVLEQSTLQPTNEQFTIKYHDMDDVVDFLVLYQYYNSYKGKHWKKGDRIRSQIDNCWWKGTVQKVENKEYPFLNTFVHWDNGDKEHLSPWDLEALDHDTMEIADGEAVSDEQLKKSLYIPTSEEWNNIGRESECTRISEAIASIMELALSEPFNFPVDLTQYPEYMLDVEYMMDFNLIKARVDNHFYRRIDAIIHDLQYIAINAQSFNIPKSDIVRNARIVSKVAIEIVRDTSKTKDDVSQIYHRIADNFQWSASEDEDNDDEDDDNEEKETRSSSKRNGGNQSSRVPRKSKKVTSPNMNPKKWKHDCDELIKEMCSLPYSVPFREPVSEIEFPDYHRYIATPMDLSTVRESLQVGDYNSPVDFQKDVKLIFKNSKDFNTNTKSKVLGMTYKLEEWFEQRIGTLIHDWKMTTRRLTMAKRNHKAKKQDKSPVGYSGKGKGKGKGQSNKINRTKKNKNNDSSEEDDDDSDEDYNDPKPGPSSRVVTYPRASAEPKKKMPSRVAPPLRNAMTERGLRTSSRQSRPPLRFQENSDEDDEEDSESANDDQQPKRVTRLQEASPTSTASQPSTSRGLTSRNSKSEVKNNDNEEDESDEEAPLITKKSNLKRSRTTPDPVVNKKESEEEEPLVKRVNTSKVEENASSEEDIPLAARRKTPQPSPTKTPTVRHSSRPQRPNRRFEETESEPEVHQQQRRTPSKRQRSTSTASPRRRPTRSTRSQKSKNSNTKRRASKRARYEEHDDEEENSGSDGTDSSDGSSDSSGSSSTSEESSEEPAPRRSRGNSRNLASEASPRTRPRQNNQRSRRALPDEESEEEVLPQRRRRAIPAEESEEEVLPQRKRRQQIERSNRHRLGSTSSNVGTSRRRNVQRTNYYEGDESDENTNNPGRTGAVARRPVRQNPKRKPSNRRKKREEEEEQEESSGSSDSSSSSDDSDSESDISREQKYLKKHKKKTTVTSRGRVSKPNPRNF